MKQANVDFEQAGTAFRLCGLHVWKLGGLLDTYVVWSDPLAVRKAHSVFAHNVTRDMTAQTQRRIERFQLPT